MNLFYCNKAGLRVNRQNNIVAGNNSQLHFLLAMRGY